MELDYRVENLDTVDETVRGLYQEKTEGDSKYYVLSVKGVKPEAEFKAVYNALTKERESRSDFEKKYKAFGEDTPESIATLKSELDSLKAAKSTTTEEDFVKRLNAQKEASSLELDKLRNAFAEKEQGYLSTIKEREAEVIGMRLENELKTAYEKRGDSSGFALALSLAKGELTWSQDANGFRTHDNLGDISDWMEETFNRYPCLLKGNSSGRASGGSSTAISAEKYFNPDDAAYNSDEYLAKRADFFRKNPEKAREFIQKFKR